MSSRKRIITSRIVVCLAALILSFSIPVAGMGNIISARAETGASEYAPLTVSMTLEHLSKHGNVHIDLKQQDAWSAGYEKGDIVTVSFLGQELDLPLVEDYSNVESQTAGLFAMPDSEYFTLAINMGDFATTYHIAEKTTYPDKTYIWNYCDGVTAPVTFTISMKEKGGYYDEYVLHQLSYTNERSDYADLSDEEFANFREVSTTGIGSHTLFRTASPIDNARGRSAYADAAIKNAGIEVIVNLSDNESTIRSYDTYNDSYYSTTKYVGLNMGMDFAAADFRSGLADGLKFMAVNPGVYAIHCLEGKDRTGFVAAVLECLMGAGYDEVVEDYMTTFYNYYGIKENDPRYTVIAESNIIKSLQTAYGVTDLKNADLEAEAEEYVRELGLAGDTIKALKANLAADNHVWKFTDWTYETDEVTKEVTAAWAIYTCELDGLHTMRVPATIVKESVAATCQKEGMDSYTLSVPAEDSPDGQIHEVTNIASFGISKLEHQWDQGIVTKLPTTDLTGIRTYTCLLCNQQRTETIPVLVKHADEDTGLKEEPTAIQKVTEDPKSSDEKKTNATYSVNSPMTGDPANTIIWILMLSFAGIVVSVMTCMRLALIRRSD